MVIGTVIIGVGIGLAGAGLLAFALGNDSDKTFTREGIMAILSKESTVYFSDGKTKVGTFYEGQHRDYVPYDSIPPILVQALVSAEDHNFFEHKGIDIKAIGHAMIDNIKHGSIRRGGSTLTQQTAKNLFNRRGRTISGKLKELANAYQLEKHFSKQEILEFYLNQFFVSGNGHGVRIAARYFFNKDLSNLNLLECAFIAGSVKGPNQYNPFIQETPAKKEAALQKGRYRVAYVLKQLYELKKITKDQYVAASHQKLEFHRGAFRFTLSTNMVKVKKLLESKGYQEILAKNDVEDFTTDGLQIYTTLDANLQNVADYTTNSNLSRLDLILRGYHPPKDSAVTLVSSFAPGEFYTGKIVKAAQVKKDGTYQPLEIEFGSSRAIVSGAGLDKFFKNWNMHEVGSMDLPSIPQRQEVLKKYFGEGHFISCAFPLPILVKSENRKKAESENKGPIELEIVQHPEIQGGTEILREGKVLANVGGFKNTGYDRVNQARRQFGSTFKPLVYAAALELGWKPLDALCNFRQLFRIGTVFYFPKPDHSPEDTVSMAWAGRRSENVASIYLLYHLFDKTPAAKFWEVAKEMHIAPENFPMQGDFEIYVRDSLGLALNQDRMREIFYQKENADIGIDLTFEGKVQEGEAVKSLPFGLGFAREAEKVAGSSDKEDMIRAKILSKNFLSYYTEAKNWENRANNGLHFTVARHNTRGSIGIFSNRPDTNWTPIAEPEAWVGGDSALVEGEVGVGTLKRIEAKLNAHNLDENSGYTKENLFASQDFRALAALKYIVQFSRKLGITSALDPVISFPLGVNVITLGEAVNAYQALKDGYIYKSKMGEKQLFIEKICTNDGKVIYEDYLDREKVISDKTRFGIEAILGTVVKGGTGQQIGRELKVHLDPNQSKGGTEMFIPAYGKTGTTNDYRNGAFIGFIASPRGSNKGFDSQEGYTIGDYVGFDDNVSMLRKGFKGTGSSVAIPAWIAQARSIASIDSFTQRVDLLDLDLQSTGQPPLFQQEKYIRYVVSKRTGLPINGADEEALKAKSATYTEDLSDELMDNPGLGDPSAFSTFTTLLIREE